MRPRKLNLGALARCLLVVAPLIYCTASERVQHSRVVGVHTHNHPNRGHLHHHHLSHHQHLQTVRLQEYERPPSYNVVPARNTAITPTRAPPKTQLPKEHRLEFFNVTSPATNARLGLQQQQSISTTELPIITEPTVRTVPTLSTVPTETSTSTTLTTTTMAPINFSRPVPTEHPAMDQEDRELLCIFGLYTDSLILVDKDLDMSDRLVFFVPLIIIYWHHRHPHAPLPFKELDGLLRDLGPEAHLHRLVLLEFAQQLAAANQCRGHSDSTQQASLMRLLFTQHQQEQARAIEAIRILKIWLDEEDQQILQASDQADQAAQTAQTARQSGARQISRHWFRDLVNQNRRRFRTSSHRGGNASRLTSEAPSTSTAKSETSQELSLSSLTPPVTEAGSTEMTTPESPFSVGLDETLSDMSTEKPYGWPYFAESRITPTEPRAEASTSDIQIELDTTLLNRVRDLRPTSTVALSTTSSSPTASTVPLTGQPMPNYHGELFHLVSRIIDDINQLNNSTSGPVLATSPMPITANISTVTRMELYLA